MSSHKLITTLAGAVPSATDRAASQKVTATLQRCSHQIDRAVLISQPSTFYRPVSLYFRNRRYFRFLCFLFAARLLLLYFKKKILSSKIYTMHLGIVRFSSFFLLQIYTCNGLEIVL